MARLCVCVPVVATALLLPLLLLFATVSRSAGPRGRELQGSPRIPAQFREEELFAMKEALKGAIQIPTVSFSREESNTTALAELGEYIHKVFPTVFNTSFIKHEVVEKYSHLFTVQGSDPSLQPYMLMAHLDVVPAPEEGWEVPPFSGLEQDGFIHGRGTLDNKNSVMAILQALDLLLTRNYQPRRSFFIALGHDEEVYGTKGAQKISALLQARGVQLAFLVDEGSFIMDGLIPSLSKPFAMISVSEKGALDLMLQVNMTPGHSSAPPKETSIGILSAAVSRLEQTPMPNMFGSGTLKKTLEQLANEFPFPGNILLNNLWLFRPLVSRLMERNHITNALVRTTTALTMFHAGIKVNVIPPLARAIINFRIHPAQTVHELIPTSSLSKSCFPSGWGFHLPGPGMLSPPTTEVYLSDDTLASRGSSCPPAPVRNGKSPPYRALAGPFPPGHSSPWPVDRVLRASCRTHGNICSLHSPPSICT